MTAYVPGPHATRVIANLAVLRALKGWTFVDLAEALAPLPNGQKLNASTLWRLEARRRWVTVDELFMFADVYEVDPADLLFGAFTLTPHRVET